MTSSDKSPRLNWIDIAKGIGIILVVLGHCIFPCHQLIDVFHMPLFFFIAGLTYRHKEVQNFIISKINRIGVPFIFWTIISFSLSLIPHPYTGPFNAPLWFFQAIFVGFILTYMSQCFKTKYQIIIAIIAFLIVGVIIYWNIRLEFPFNLIRAFMAYLYIYVGILFRRYSNYWDKDKHRKTNSWLFTIGFLLLFGYLFKYEGLSGAFFNLSIYKSNYSLVCLCSILGILMTILLSQLIGKSNFLEFCGRNSLVIMCVHFPLAQILNVHIAKLAIYQILWLRAVAAIIEYSLIFGFSFVMVWICKKYLPRMNGYSPLI